jgi:hypothetical protein
MAILPTYIRILFTNYDIIAYFLNLASCSEHFIGVKHRILAFIFKIRELNSCYSPAVNHCPKEFGIILHSMCTNVFQNTLGINNYKCNF